MNKFQVSAYGKQYNSVAKKEVLLSDSENLEDLVREARSFGLWANANVGPVQHLDIRPAWNEANNILPDGVTEISVRLGA